MRDNPKVRSVRRSDGSTEWWPGHRPSPRRRELSRATLQGGVRKFFKVVLANVDILLAASLHRPSPPQGACATHSRVARNRTSDMACCATIGQGSHLENSTMQMHVEGYADLEWPIDAHAIAGIFHARASVTPKRVLRSLRTPKVLATVRQTKRATLGASRIARPSKCAISRSKHKSEEACPTCTQPQKS